VNLSINPIYQCNFKCKWCYLSYKQRNSFRIADLDQIENRIKEVLRSTRITHIDIYGGEVALLSEEYLNQLYAIIGHHTNCTINVITNLSEIHPFFLKNEIDLSVSFDYKARKEYERVWSNMLLIDRPISVLMLVTKDLIKYKPQEVLDLLNLNNNIVSLELKPYSQSRYNRDPELDQAYIGLVKWLIKNKRKANFEIINETKIRDSLKGRSNPFSDDHLYITPRGKFAVLEFDGDGREYFKELKGFKEYTRWAKSEPDNIMATNTKCQECVYWGECISEHLHPFRCTGFKELLDWYQEEILEENDKQFLEHWAKLA